MITEIGELADQVSSSAGSANPTTFDRINAIEEIGDILWYAVLALRSMDSSILDAMTRVENKLQTRYGDAFSESAAINRDLDAERKALEGDE
jgi:NTP pyrophosphatase (non-canonical NTP hydrolase)